MDFELTESQKMLKKVARNFLSTECPKSLVRAMETDGLGYSPELWHRLSSLGWLGLVIPEEYAGVGGSFCDLIVLLEEMGRACLPGPFFSTVVLGGMTIQEFGSEEQRRELLPKIAGGKAIITVAIREAGRSYDTSKMGVKAFVDGGNYIIRGTKLFVHDAHIADYIICACRSPEGITLFLVPGKSPSVRSTVLKTISGDKQCEVAFEDVVVTKGDIVGELGRGRDHMQLIMLRAAVAKCAEMIGSAQQVLEITLDYVKQRIQFGQPVGAFQAVQHHCSNMATDIEVSRLLTFQAAWRLSEGLPSAREAAMAKAWVSDACRRVTLLGHQCIGGVGLMEDHDLPLYSRRAKGAEVQFGDVAYHREAIAQELGL